MSREFVGDRYGELDDFIPFGADYVSQVRWTGKNEYYWWLPPMQNGSTMRTNTLTQENMLQRYQRHSNPKEGHTGIDYRQFINFLDKQLLPQGYFEIGTNNGESAQQTSCNAILIDPHFQLTTDVVGKRRQTHLYQMTSDDYFESQDPRNVLSHLDIGFLDGLHHFEALLKDFINFERHSHDRSCALIHDCLPLNTRMAGRIHQSGPEQESAITRGFWTGDVWRLLPILQEFRPDLEVFILDCPPTGLVLCRNLNARSTILMFKYEEIVERFKSLSLDQFGLEGLWTIFPTLDTKLVTSYPELFCRYTSFRPI